MKMITLLSWKNIWRSKKRSLVVIGSIAVGVWALIFLFAFLNSFNEAYVRNAIQYDYSHIQIHHPGYRLDPNLKTYIRDKDKVLSEIDQQEHLLARSGRTIINGMIATGRGNQGVEIMGIVPEMENKVTHLEENLKQGTYFTNKHNSVLIGIDLANKLGVKIRSKVVLTFLDKDNNITSAAFRIEGIFESKSPRINKGVIYVKQDKLQQLVQTNEIQEIGILLDDNTYTKTVVSEIKKRLPDEEVLSYDELAPEFELLKQQSSVSKKLLTVIVMLALLFGIINTMLMAVLERTREIGMLLAIGMHRRKVFLLIMIETIFLSMVGGPIGILLGYFTVSYFHGNGMDLSSYATSLRDYGYDTIFYPVLSDDQYPVLMLVVIATAIIGSIYPAVKAINLNPLEALRKF